MKFILPKKEHTSRSASSRKQRANIRRFNNEQIYKEEKINALVAEGKSGIAYEIFNLLCSNPNVSFAKAYARFIIPHVVLKGASDHRCKEIHVARILRANRRNYNKIATSWNDQLRNLYAENRVFAKKVCDYMVFFGRSYNDALAYFKNGGDFAYDSSLNCWKLFSADK